VVHNAGNTNYLAGAVDALQTLYGDRADTVTNPNAADALRAIGQVDGDLVVACHGAFSPDHPGDGYLEIGAMPWRLTFDALFSSVVLRRCRTVVLAACTSSVSRAKVAAELVGLPSMLLAAGARYVVGSAWPVNELATSMLLTNYLTLAAQGIPPVCALNQAQREFVATAPEEICGWCARNLPSLAEKVGLSVSVFGDHPFESPEYWAGFGITGDF
jgi:CHAT domain-containing protein